MRIVDPEAVKAEAQKPKRTRRKGPVRPTPSQYQGSYITMGCSLEHGTYYMKARDPGAVFAKRIKDTINTPHRDSENAMLRAVAFSNSSSNTWGRTTFGAAYMDDATAMGIPSPTKGQPGTLEWVQAEIEKQRVENSLTTMMSRLKMLLGMVGEVQELDNPGFQWAYRPTKFFKLKGYTLALMEGRDE